MSSCWYINIASWSPLKKRLDKQDKKITVYKFNTFLKNELLILRLKLYCFQYQDRDQGKTNVNQKSSKWK